MSSVRTVTVHRPSPSIADCADIAAAVDDQFVSHRIVHRGSSFRVQENRPANGIAHWRTVDVFDNLVHARRCYPAASFDDAAAGAQANLEALPHEFECSFFEPSECRICGIHMQVHRGHGRKFQRIGGDR